jgi:transposase
MAIASHLVLSTGSEAGLKRAVPHRKLAWNSHTNLLAPKEGLRRFLIGYLQGIRSERRLVEEVHLNLAYRCGQAHV